MGIYRAFDILPGVRPLTDGTAISSRHWQSSFHCRFVNGMLQKIGGWEKELFYRDEVVSGVPRSLYSIELLQRSNLIIGTHTRLYDVNGGKLYNITPFTATSLPAASSLSTQYGLLATNPFGFTNGSNRVAVTDTQFSRFRVGDLVTLSGAVGTISGIPSAELNATHVIREILANGYAIRVASNATATAVGGGGAINRSSGLIRVTVANALSEGDRVKIEDASILRGVSATVTAPGSGYSTGDVLTVSGGDFSIPAKFNVASTQAVSVSVAFSGYSGYVPGGTLTAVGGTFTTAATATIATTKVISATVNGAGTGGTNGQALVTGTTGAGTQFQALVTIAGGVMTAVNSISVAGSYTTNPTLTASPVTGGGLTGAKLNLAMGVNTVTLGTAGNYTANPVSPVSTSGTGTGATLNVLFGVQAITLNNAGKYVATPTNPAGTTGAGSGATLTVAYSGSSNVGGISSADINGEFFARNVTGTYFDFMTEGTASSSVSSAGGTSVVYFTPIPAGTIDEVAQQGYGAGLYGVGLYGTALVSDSGRIYPRI